MLLTREELYGSHLLGKGYRPHRIEEEGHRGIAFSTGGYNIRLIFNETGIEIKVKHHKNQRRNGTALTQALQEIGSCDELFEKMKELGGKND